MKITVYKGEICELRDNGDIYKDGKLVYKKPQSFDTIAIGKDGKIR